MEIVNGSTDAINGKNENDPGPKIKLKIHHPTATEAMTPPIHAMKPPIVERNHIEVRISANAIGAPIIIAPSLEAKKDNGNTRAYANSDRICS
jgi:hypothetical protein